MNASTVSNCQPWRAECSLKRGGVLCVVFVGDEAHETGPKPRPLGKILRCAGKQADSVKRLGHNRNRDSEGIARLKS